MIVPLTLKDFLERAELVYGDRVAVVDEPNPPGGGLGRFTYAQFGEMARSLAVGARRSRRRPERARGDRVPQRRALPGEPLRCQRLRPHPGAGELPPQRRGDPLHPRTLRALRCCWSIPSWTSRCATSRSSTASCSAPRATRSSSCARAPAEALGAGRERHRVDQLHLRHHRAAQGRAAHPPQLLAQRGDLRLAPGPERSRRLPAHAADLPLQRLGHAVRGDRHGRAPGHHPQDRRRGDPEADRGARA